MTKVEVRYIDLARIMLGISGYDVLYNRDSRKVPLPTIRAMIYDKLRTEGYSFVQIGEALNKNHSIIIYAVQTLHDMLECPRTFDTELIDLYKKFNEAVTDSVTGTFTQSEWTALKELVTKISNII